ncbi:tRNA glutamyl-Q(34) synthetase GluQRS [Oceanicoccus sagamiensis]|uniref:Glutamyl-Q tRNA(Asp) synthetase n=1 Tax=Oceanicoccus sagamiensis TaxID=716816 RepID=A0A1X9N717_9GAMM|nr:tRNA glutamyl-Q(34) synthetase GluQRS [Oceanicoccus sagamiensis]ARN73496.1 tRNA glutamyl-Q(34) synthetase GluQRS [Oceanicoccus sagamiensis]
MNDYIGRFAPSPTGLLHIGSLIGALASFLDARANQGQWLLRMEDLDPPREMPGAASAILQSLEDHGLAWDGEVLWQSQRHDAYRQVIDDLLLANKAFYCTCSRSDLQASHGIYQGQCRGCVTPPADQDFALRLQVDDRVVSFDDAIQGRFSQQLDNDVGDVVLQRKDGLFAYQLAVVVDDAYQAISHVVRGSDLLDSTPRQIYLQQVMAYTTPGYTHIPVITNEQGDKLSKQTFAAPLDSHKAAKNIYLALMFLNQPLPPEDLSQRVDDILAWALANWSVDRIPSVAGLPQSTIAL